MSEGSGALARISTTLECAVEQLTRDRARDEALAEFVPARRVLLIMRDPAMKALGRVWRLGVFLLGADGVLYATGSTTRAVPPRHPGYQSISAEERRGYRAAAFAGKFERGETVNFDAEPIALDEESLATAGGPLFVAGGRPLVRWNATVGDEGAIEFESYVAERVALLSPMP